MKFLAEVAAGILLGLGFVTTIICLTVLKGL